MTVRPPDPLSGELRYESTEEGLCVDGFQVQPCSEEFCEWCTVDRPAFFRAPGARLYSHDAPPYILSTPASGVSNGHVFINGAAIDGRLGSRRYCVGECGCPQRHKTED
jgi:hypothetical protein